MNAPQRSNALRGVRQSLAGTGAPCARLIVSWTSGGGIAAGGILVGAAALNSPELAQPLVSLAPVLFLFGALGGFVLGSLLAWTGRPDGVTPETARAAIGAGVAVSVPALIVSWVVTAWISLTAAVLTMHSPLTVALVAIGWVVGLWMCMWAAWEGWQAARALLARVREHVRVRTTPAW